MNPKIRIVAAAVISLAAFWLLRWIPAGADPACADSMLRAGRIMERAVSAIRNHRELAGSDMNRETDPNRTGLIGPEYSPLMTTVGDLEAKRSTVNPNMAGLIVHLLCNAGIRPGDSVAIGSSGSFPALLVASLAAASALEVRPVTILSLGASAYGATDPDFTLLDIYEILMREGICSREPEAVSLGGAKDVGKDLESGVRDRLRRRIESAGILFLDEPDLEKNVTERIRLYDGAASGRIAAFINCGGADANIGTSPLVLEVPPGLSTRLVLPPPGQRGVLFAMSARGVPVIHLLHIRGLVTRFGLPWDPIPLPEPAVIHPAGKGKPDWRFWLLTGAYFALLAGLAAGRRKTLD
jgi:poly-gamma-glutamate system protein